MKRSLCGGQRRARQLATVHHGSFAENMREHWRPRSCKRCNPQRTHSESQDIERLEVVTSGLRTPADRDYSPCGPGPKVHPSWVELSAALQARLGNRVTGLWTGGDVGEEPVFCNDRRKVSRGLFRTSLNEIPHVTLFVVVFNTTLASLFIPFHSF